MVLRGAMVFQNTIAPFQHKCNHKPSTAPCGRKGEISMACTEAYREHIMYSFNAFCKVVIRYAAINAWRDRNRRRQREISFEYLTEEKFHPLSTSDEALIFRMTLEGYGPYQIVAQLSSEYIPVPACH